MMNRVRLTLAATAAVAVLAACGSPGSSGDQSSDQGTKGSTDYTVGLVYSKSGPLATYGQQYRQGFTAGLDYATKGTGAVDGHKIVITEQDDGGDPAKATSAVTTLVGQGAKIIAGSTASGVALPWPSMVRRRPISRSTGLRTCSGSVSPPSARSGSTTGWQCVPMTSSA